MGMPRAVAVLASPTRAVLDPRLYMNTLARAVLMSSSFAAAAPPVIATSACVVMFCAPRKRWPMIRDIFFTSTRRHLGGRRSGRSSVSVGVREVVDVSVSPIKELIQGRDVLARLKSDVGCVYVDLAVRLDLNGGVAGSDGHGCAARQSHLEGVQVAIVLDERAVLEADMPFVGGHAARRRVDARVD